MVLGKLDLFYSFLPSGITVSHCIAKKPCPYIEKTAIFLDEFHSKKFLMYIKAIWQCRFIFALGLCDDRVFCNSCVWD